MGGMGSGRHWYLGAKEATTDYRAIDVRLWKKEGLLNPHQLFGWQWSRNGKCVASIQMRTEPDRVILTYRHRSYGQDWKDESYPVFLDWTSCHLGGQRPWFLCPAWNCGRRVAILYGGGIFACRHCYQLAYPSQRESPDDRAARRANKIREKLGWEPGILNGRGWKPKGMHWSTFERLTTQHDAFVQVSLAEVAGRLNLFSKSLDSWI
ncbi:hypothetical protein [Nitrosococcus wardiae]|uniref:Uncharacterized protein n=1 Tax=Nitrosococcus wardiae TaxID=1814290 RepID=A0A4V1AWC1_9GAMM|nr:hypothetical protein [Nitrosococcus wardiae]QBQ56115.1 hypothetical protein E3U44_17560 [Nitrosococcus wardiae]